MATTGRRAGTESDLPPARPLSARPGPGRSATLRLRVAAAIVDVFVYVVVLNLFVEYLPSVLSETFTLSLLTAALLKVVLEVVVAVKNQVKARIHRAATAAGKVGAALMLWALLIGSKFAVLKAVDLVFRDRVSLGGFVPVTLLILTLLTSRAAVRHLLRGPRESAPDTGKRR